jgi:hypothetical protein
LGYFEIPLLQLNHYLATHLTDTCLGKLRKIRTMTRVTLMQQWLSTDWGDEMAVVQSLLGLHPGNF